MASFKSRLLVAFFSFASASPLYAVGVGMGLAAVDSMSDRAEPAATLQMDFGQSSYSQLYYWGRDYGPVSERNFVASFVFRTPLPEAKFLNLHYGVVASDHTVSLYDNAASKAQVNPPEVEKKSDYNLGGLLGLGVEGKVGVFKASFHWDSQIYLTGSQAIIFLTSARKQTLSLLVGVDL